MMVMEKSFYIDGNYKRKMRSKDIEEMANSFKSYDKMYDDLLEFGVESLYHPIELEWMMEYFTKKEDYEKCSILENYINQIKDEEKGNS